MTDVIHAPSIAALPYPNGVPLRWQDDQSGVLPDAVASYYLADQGQAPPLTAAQVAALVAYCRYYVNAPCWRESPAGTLAGLRAAILVVETEAALDLWLDAALDAGLDPL